jgi:serine/threonine protein kinase
MASSHLTLEVVVQEEDRLIARCLLRRGRYIIGQERKNEIVADAASISSRHARLTVASDEQFFLEDLGSANGTFVDGHPISDLTPVTLESHIALGQATLSFQRGGLPASVFRHLPEGFLRAARYALDEVMVEGRTSTIYEARDSVLHRRVALKVLHRDAQANPRQVLSFIRENQIVAQLAHSCILPVYDFGLDDEIGLFSATRFVEGESFGALLAGMASANRQAPQATLHGLLAIFLKICDALAFANARGVVHGTLHPDAVIFGRFGEVFVDHWAYAKIGAPIDNGHLPVHAPAATTQSPVSRCLAPEQAAGGDEFDERADVYALGTILFRILTLRHFNTGESEEEVIAQALQPVAPVAEALAAASLPPHLRGGIPERLALLCVKALAPNPDERVRSAHDLKAEVVHWLEQVIDAGSRQGSWKLSGLFGKK